MNVKRLTAAYKNDAGKIVRGNAALMHNININGGIKKRTLMDSNTILNYLLNYVANVFFAYSNIL